MCVIDVLFLRGGKPQLLMSDEGYRKGEDQFGSSDKVGRRFPGGVLAVFSLGCVNLRGSSECRK